VIKRRKEDRHIPLCRSSSFRWTLVAGLTLQPSGLRVKRVGFVLAFVAALGLLLGILPNLQAAAQTAKKEKDGKWETADGTPTYNITGDGTVDWYTFSGFRRYHSECHVCHGPDGEGSSYAPGLMEPLKTQNYYDFMTVVASGREVIRADKQSKMPALGDNRNVMCYIDDIYVYLKARSDGALPRGRPAKRIEKPEAAEQHEKACFGGK
jgi:methanol metabolism-related c-type cytochrome